MRMRILTVLGLAAVTAGTRVAPVFAWGQYGHEAINEAAVDLLSKHGDAIGALFSSDTDVLKRLAITPDMDWKMIGNNSGLDPQQYAEKKAADGQEHPLHFFEADTYEDPSRGLDSLSDLPTGDYQSAAPILQKRMMANETQVQAMDPSKPLNTGVHGTAPWRILQMYDLGVAALKAGDTTKALLYLGALGHYVGDMSQPFHTTMDYDGDQDTPPSAGIHATFEEKILERAGHFKAQRDPNSLLWDLRATHAKVAAAAAAASGQYTAAIPREQIVAAVLDLVRSGYSGIQPLLKAYSDQCALAQEGKLQSADMSAQDKTPYCVAEKNPNDPFHAKTRVSTAIVDAFSAAPMDQGGTVLGYAEVRMGAAAALLDRIWESAWIAAGKPALQNIRVSFDDLHALDNYPKPDYLQASVGTAPVDPSAPPSRIRRRKPSVPQELQPQQ